MAADPKPDARVVATRSEWEALRQHKLHGQSCRVCGGLAATLHHLVPRSLGGDDLGPNLVPLCGDGTLGCHGRVEAKSAKAIRDLRHALTPEEEDYVIKRKGYDFLVRYYPRHWPGP